MLRTKRTFSVLFVHLFVRWNQVLEELWHITFIFVSLTGGRLKMENYHLLPSEIDLENRLKKELKIVESTEDPEITYRQYLYVNAFKSDFPGVSVYQDGEKWKLHMEYITYIDGLPGALNSVLDILNKLLQTNYPLADLGRQYLDLLSEDVCFLFACCLGSRNCTVFLVVHLLLLLFATKITIL